MNSFSSLYLQQLNEENRRTLWNALESTTSKSNIEFYAQLKDHYLWLKSSRQRD